MGKSHGIGLAIRTRKGKKMFLVKLRTNLDESKWLNKVSRGNKNYKKFKTMLKGVSTLAFNYRRNVF